MTTSAPIPPITGSINSWWPHQFHIGAADVAECDRGRVLLWEPPNHLVFTWQINGTWQFDPDPGHASEIDVRFTANGPHDTTVEVEHRHLERLDGGGTINDAIKGGGGWTLLLGSFARTVADRP